MYDSLTSFEPAEHIPSKLDTRDPGPSIKHDTGVEMQLLKMTCTRHQRSGTIYMYPPCSLARIYEENNGVSLDVKREIQHGLGGKWPITFSPQRPGTGLS
jgi:hypothetical protein